jgi:phospholipid transport system substrate-binding protein
MVARHQGIFGLGLLLTVGAVAGLTASLIVLPVLLRRPNPAERVPTSGAGVRRTAMTSLMIAGVLLVPLAVVGLAMAGEPTEQVRAAVTELYQTVTSSRGAADSRQREAAVQVMDRLFDWRTMARQSLRQHWEARTPAEREQFTRLFADVFRQAYLARIFLVDASKFRYVGDRITGDRAIVDTRVTTKRGSEIAVVYVAAQDRGPQWRVEDVRVEGISLLDSYRTQFDSIIVRSSYEALVKRLQDRLKQPG